MHGIWISGFANKVALRVEKTFFHLASHIEGVETRSMGFASAGADLVPGETP